MEGVILKPCEKSVVTTESDIEELLMYINSVRLSLHIKFVLSHYLLI